MADLLSCVRACDLWSAQASACLETCYLNSAELSSTSFFDDDSPGLPLPATIAIAALLVPLSGLFAGLTLGLLSLDLVGLRILASAGEPHEREYAKAIIPVRSQGNLLLCTLLLGNTVINSAISILLAHVTSGPIGLLASTGLILLFGEILPQSVATRHGLKLGAESIWIVRFFMVLLAPVVYPLAILLDWLLGRDIGNVYSVEELKRLIEIHVTDPHAQAESGLTRADQQLIMGALEYKQKRVRDVMTSLDKTFMLERCTRLNFQTMLAIYKSGFTRIPVYEGSRHNIVGILYAKDLILIDSDDEVEVGAVVSFRGREVARVSEDDTLDRVFKRFLTGNNHMLIACATPGVNEDGIPDCTPSGASADPTGLITLEDVLEEVLQEEIVDETDIYEDVDRRVLRRGGNRVDIASFLTLFEHKLPHTQALSPSEMQAVKAFLSINVEEFAVLGHFGRPLEGLIGRSQVLEQEVYVNQRDPSQLAPLTPSTNSSTSPAPVGEWGLTRMASRHISHNHTWEEASAEEAPPLVLYQRGQPSDTFTLILQGRVLIRTGQEGFELEMGPWSVLGNRALSHSDYQPDFDAVAIAPFRLLRVSRADYTAAVQATTLDPHIGRHQRGRYAGTSQAPSFDVVVPPPGAGMNGVAPAASPPPAWPNPKGPLSPIIDSPTPASRPQSRGNGVSSHSNSPGDATVFSPGPQTPDGDVPAKGRTSPPPQQTPPWAHGMAPSPAHGVNNAAEAGAVASEASQADSARAEAALRTPPRGPRGGGRGGLGPGLLSPARNTGGNKRGNHAGNPPGGGAQTLADGIANLAHDLFRSASDTHVGYSDVSEPLLRHRGE